jgi:hypothetical protein
VTLKTALNGKAARPGGMKLADDASQFVKPLTHTRRELSTAPNLVCQMDFVTAFVKELRFANVKVNAKT